MRRLVLASVSAAAVGLAVVPAAAVASASSSDTPSTAATCDVLSTPAHFTGTVPSPRQVLGFAAGDREATGEEIGTYWHAVDAASDRVVTGTFANSWQGRPLN